MNRALAAVFLIVVFNSCGRGEQEKPVAEVLTARPKAPALNNIDSHKFEEVRRAGQKVKSATGLGVSISRYRELVEALDVEIALARDNASNELEQQVIRRYGEALDSYKDVLPIWSLKFVRSTQLYYELIGEDDGLVFPDGRHSQIIARYGIPYAPSEGREAKAIAGNKALQRIWEAAGKKLDEANKASRG